MNFTIYCNVFPEFHDHRDCAKWNPIKHYSICGGVGGGCCPFWDGSAIYEMR